jgi:uncharacterized membrane protein
VLRAADGGRGPGTVPLGLWPGVMLSILAGAALVVPPVVYHAQHFHLGWHDVGNYVRANYNFFEFGRFAIWSDGSGDFFAEQHFEPFFFLLCVPVRLFGTPGYLAAITAAIVLAAGYVFALATAVSKSRSIGALCAAAYVLNPYTSAVALNYHPETFGVLFILAFAYHAYVDQRGRAWLALLLAFTVKEDMWVYAAIVALLVARRDRLKQTLAFLTAALCYYLVVVLLIGGWLYPTANYFNSFYESEGQPLTKVQIALQLLGRWREFIPLLFTGPGAQFQMSFLFIGILGGWRYVLVGGVMLMWLTYPGGPPRSNFSFYYSYAALLVSFVLLPFALVNLRAVAAAVARRLHVERGASWAVALVMGLVLSADVVMHLPWCAPDPIARAVVPWRVFSTGHGVNVPIVRSLVTRYLPAEAGSVLAQFYTFASIPQRQRMYITLHDRDRFLDGRLRPKFVLLDLGAADPWTPPADIRAMAILLRRGDVYRPIYDARGVLLYQRIGNDGA